MNNLYPFPKNIISNVNGLNKLYKGRSKEIRMSLFNIDSFKHIIPLIK